MKVSPEIFLDIRGLIPNAISSLVGLALAYTIKDPVDSKSPTENLIISIRLLNLVTAAPEGYRYIEDIVNHQLLGKINNGLEKLK